MTYRQFRRFIPALALAVVTQAADDQGGNNTLVGVTVIPAVSSSLLVAETSAAFRSL